MDTCMKIAKNKDLAEELYQYFFLLLLEKEDEYVEKLYDGGYLQWWSIRVLHTAINGNRHPFQKNRIYDNSDVYEMNILDNFTDHLVEREEREEDKNKLQSYEAVMAETYWYERELFKMHLNGMSARSIHRQTNISVREVLRVIKLMKSLIVEKYEKG